MISLVVVNHCRFGSNKQIGATKVPLRKTRPNETIFFRKLLEANLPTVSSILKWKQLYNKILIHLQQKSISSSELDDRGKIYLGLEYSSNKEALIVEIIKGAGLVSHKSSCPNPYVKWYIYSYIASNYINVCFYNLFSYLVNGPRSTSGQLKRKTKVVYKTTDPVFEEVCIYVCNH